MLSHVQRVAERIIRKASRENDPLNALAETPEFAKFERSLYLAIRKQFKAFMADPPNDMQADDIAKWLDDNLPSFTEFLDPQDVFEFYKFAFVWGIKGQYQRLGINLSVKKADEARPIGEQFAEGVVAGFAWSYDGETATFNLTNPEYIAALEDSADYLLNRSGIDQTTKNQLIKTVQQGRTAGKTIQELVADLQDEFEDLSTYRAARIARTESAHSMGAGNFAAMVKNGVKRKRWVTAGPGCDICRPNVDDGWIPLDEAFSSGAMFEPAHPNCECYTEAEEIDLDSIDIWGGQ